VRAPLHRFVAKTTPTTGGAPARRTCSLSYNRHSSQARDGVLIAILGQGRGPMSATIINLIIQIIAGAIGGNAVGASSTDESSGTLCNTIAGAIGGVGGGQLLTALIPMMVGVGNNVDIGTWLGSRGWRRRRDRCGHRATRQRL
jgi:uncharacterized membrane protein YeaQ/YmgE (transglycosylase-associated protein family)